MTKDGISFTYDSDGKVIKQSNGLEFIYDHTGVVGFTYGNNTYIYRKDVQGNIIAILNSSGVVVVKYEYDAWGNHGVEVLDSSCETLANLNPFRYRGYYYDTETDLYFLKSRYYDPEIGRFMTIDGVSYLKPNAINGLNLYAYCNNNPVMGIDPYGNAWWNPFSWDWSAIEKTIDQVSNTISNTISNIAKNLQDAYVTVKESISLVSNNIATTQSVFNDKPSSLSTSLALNNRMTNNSFSVESVSADLIPSTGANPNPGIAGPGMGISGGPYINPNAKGWGKNGEFTDFQKVVAGLATFGALVGSIGAILMCIPVVNIVGGFMFSLGWAFSILMLNLGGLGGAT